MDESRQAGTAMIIDNPVTHSVPMIKGSMPNFPFKGCQSDELIKLQNEFSFRIGYDLMINPTTIINNINASAIAMINISFPAILSFITRDKIMIYQISKSGIDKKDY